MNDPEPRRRRIKYERRILLMTMAGGAPSLAAAVFLIWSAGASTHVIVTAACALGLCWIGCAFAVRRAVVFPLQTLTNLLAGLREGDASIRARGAEAGDALGDAMIEANGLATVIREQRLGAREATALLQRVMAEIDVAVFALDAERRVKLVNRAGERLLGRPVQQLLDARVDEVGLAVCMDDDPGRSMPVSIPGHPGRWEVRRSGFRLGGLPHTLLVLTDVSRSLRDEERLAWQRLMRVLGHEINNSLAPIKSIAGSLATLVARAWGQEDSRDDMQRGLEVVASRAESLGRFTSAYSRLAGLPPPRRRPILLSSVVARVVNLERPLPVTLVEGPDVTIGADPDQIEQLLINLVKNAVEASIESSGGVSLRWALAEGHVEVLIEDEGPGLAQTANLFVPFFTTKPGGSGIGLVLGRQIAEAHGGSLVLENRTDRTGCVARLRLPTVEPAWSAAAGPGNDHR
jgi:two-component system nitrogen regulation sensor histidine kinase NtrY